MELINATRMASDFTMGLEPSGRELLVVVIKGTFVLPKPGEPVHLADEQLPLVMTDTFTGDAGYSAPLQEADFAPRKAACDVLLTGHARAPAGRQVTRLRAGLCVGQVEEIFDVVGDRVWQAGLATITASEPQPFTEMLVSYDRAFGGADRHSEDPAEHDAYLPNPVGRGWHKHLKGAWVDGSPLPNIDLLQMAQRQTPAWRSSPLLMCQSADALIGLKRYDEALSMLQRVETEFPRSIRPRQLMGLASPRKGDWKGAQTVLARLKNAGEMDPETMGIYAATRMDRYVAEPNELNLRKSRDLRTTIDLHGRHIGRDMLLVFEGGDLACPIVVGMLQGAAGWPEVDGAAQVEVDADGKRMVVAAHEQLVLRYGQASITLTKAGKVLIEGSYVLTRSTGVNRIHGGSVQLN